MNLRRRLGLATALAAFASLASGQAAAFPLWNYEVTVTNLTYAQRFTPLLLASHRSTVDVFRVGSAASAELRALAEEGNFAPLQAQLQANAGVTATVAGTGLLDPGQSVTLRIQANPWQDRLSLLGMLIPTNDAFVALNAVPLPQPGWPAQTYTAVAYDAGSEVNDELCSSTPGPFFAECGGSGGGGRVGGGEGFVHVHRGLHGAGDFKPIGRDWRNPVAEVRVRLVR